MWLGFGKVSDCFQFSYCLVAKKGLRFEGVAREQGEEN